MQDRVLATIVRSYLDAQDRLQDCRARGSDPTESEVKVRMARRELARRLSDADHSEVAGYQRIVVALSDRPQDYQTLDAAVKLAYPTGAQIGLVHVIETINSYVPEAGFPPRSFIEKQYEESRQLLQLARHRIPSSVHVEEIIREGHAPAEVVRYAEEWDADLIVVGTRGGGRLIHFLRGSTAEDVMQRSKCPVLVVNYHAHVASAAAPGEPAVATPT